MRILVVDDSSVSRFVLRGLLAGHEVDEADGADHAAAMLAAGPYDLVVCDQLMGAGTGLELLRRWRAGGVGTPVLMVSAGSESVAAEVRDAIAPLGRVLFLPKPLDAAAFRDAIRTLTEG